MKLRSWWVVAAGAIAALELVFAVGVWVDRLTEDRTRELGNGVTVTVPSEFGPLLGDILLTGVVALAAVAIVMGLATRHLEPVRAQKLLVIGLIPGVGAGVVFFWFAPFWVVSIVAVALIVRIASLDVGTPARV